MYLDQSCGKGQEKKEKKKPGIDKWIALIGRQRGNRLTVLSQVAG